MSWGFPSSGATQGPQATAGPDLEEITTSALGFLTIAGETKLRLLPQPWPADRLPPNTASLLSIASRRGLLAAAGPDTIVIASTESVRQGYYGQGPAKDNVRPFTPQSTLSVPRVSQVAFSADESCLVITAEEGGGLAVYDVESVLQGNQQSAFQMSTNGASVRALVPNPAPEFAHLFAVVLGDGKLMVANVKEKQLSSVFREGVSCVSWSAKGKQLVAGLEDGTAAQYDPQGALKAQIPKPSQLADPLPMTSILWVANDDFLVVHTPVVADVPDSVYHMLHRDKASASFTSQKLAGDPCPAYGTRTPAQHYIARLRDFPPNLDDMFILSSTAATEIGFMTKSSISLAEDAMASGSAGSYTLTTMADDTKRAQLPISVANDMEDTSPIGMALDLSAKEPVLYPIPQDEMEASATPIPALMLLNNEGMLSTWWVIYNESIRRKIAYPGLTAISSTTAPAQSAQAQAAPAAQPAPSQTPTSAFGSSSFGKPAQPAFGTSTFGKPAQPAFGSTSFGNSAAPAFGSPSAPGGASSAFGKPAFGSPSAPGGASSAFGKPAFGAASSIGASNAAPGGTFGTAGGLGGKSVWGSPAASPSAAPTATFGQQTMPFGGSVSSKASGFAAIGAKDSNKPAFAGSGTENKSPLASPFSSFNQPSKPSPLGSFGQASDKSMNTPQSSFASKLPQPSTSTGTFGSASALGAKPPQWGTPAATQAPDSGNKEASMSDDEDDEDSGNTAKEATKPAAPKALFGELPKPSTEAAQSSNKSPFAQLAGDKPKASIFGQSSDKPSPFAQIGSNKTSTSPFAQKSDKPAGSIFGQPSAKPAEPAGASPFAQFGKPSGGSPAVFKLGSTFKGDGSAKDDLPAAKGAGESMFGSGFSNMLGEAAKKTAQEPATPIKAEPGMGEPSLQDIPATSTTPESPEKKDGTDARDGGDAPLPPDFVTHKPKDVEEDLPPIAGSPPVDLGDRSSQFSSPATSLANEEEEIDERTDEDWESEAADDDDDDEGEKEESEGDKVADDDDEEEGEEEESDQDDQDDTISRPPKTEAANAFGSRLKFPPQPATGSAKFSIPSTTPAGFPKAPLFPPPSQSQTSPRSPSPVRQDRLGPAPVGLSSSRQSAGKPPITVPSIRAQPPRRQSSSQRLPPQPPAEPEAGELSDDEDSRIQEILKSASEPTKILEPFVAHQDYIGQVSKPGIGGQIEKVYRDINSMIDTLGLNVRALSAFVKGHETLHKTSGRERNDLEDPDDWCLIETENLSEVEEKLGNHLAEGKLDEVKEKSDDLSELQKDVTKMRNKTADMRKQIVTRSDPQQRANHRASALNTEAQMQQSELRQGVAKVQKLLQEAEEALTVLRAGLASVPSSTTPGAPAHRAPTVEAVTNTILKMTAMIEQKSGDVDVLEAQIRRLPQGLAGLSLDDDSDMLRSSVRSLSGPPRASGYSTPPRGRPAQNGSALGMSGMLGSRYQTPQTSRLSQSTFGLAYTPEDSGELSRSVRSVRSLTGSTRKKMGDVSGEEIKHYLTKQDKRRKVLDALKAAVEKKGTRVTKFEK